MSSAKSPSLLEDVRRVMRLKHYALHTERSYCDWIKQFVKFHTLYGSGVRISEAVRLRMQDIDFGYKQITVRSGKGDKDRMTTFAASLAPLLLNHLDQVKAYMIRIWQRVTARCICLTPWRKNIPTPSRNGAGNRCFRPARCRPIRCPVRSGAIVSTNH